MDFYKDADTAIEIDPNGNVLFQNDLTVNGLTYIDDKYSIPISPPTTGQVLGTNSSGELTWLSLSDIEGAESDTEVSGNSKSLIVNQESPGTFDVSIDTSSTTAVSDDFDKSWFTKLQINSEGLVIDNGHISASDLLKK